MSNRDFQDSIATYKKALEIYEQLNDTQGKAIAHIHLGTTYLAMADNRFNAIPSIPPRPIPKPPKGPKSEERLSNIRKSIEELSIAVELSQEEDLPTQAFSLLKLGEAQALQTLELAIEQQEVEG